VTRSRSVLVVSDCHVPYQDLAAWNTCLAAIKATSPTDVVVIGDFLDGYPISNFPKSPDRRADLKYEIDAANRELDKLQKIAGKAAIHYTCGNHENRLVRFIEKQAPEFHGLVTMPELLKIKQRGIHWVDYQKHFNIGKISYTHDVGYSGKNAVGQSLAAFGHSLVFGHCLPIDYEVATTRGWVRLDEVTVSDTALTYSNGTVQTSPIEEVVQYEYTGQMACFHGSAIAQEMTDKHHIFTKDGRYVPVREAVETVRRCDLVASALPLTSGHEYSISDAMLRLIVAYAADGSLDRGRYVRFHLKKQRKIERLDSILAELGYSPLWGPTGKNGGRKLRALPRTLQDKLMYAAPGKQLPSWVLELSPRQRQLVIDELECWDGSSLRHDGVDYGCRQFSSYKSVERDIVQLLLLQHGIRSRRSGNTITYTLNRDDKATTPISNALQGWKSVRKQPVGCITTHHQNFFIRTPEGSVELTGNTHRLGVVYGGTVRGERHVACSVGWLGDFNAIDYRNQAMARREWQHGFGFVNYQSNGVGWVTAVPIINGECVIDGQRIKGKK